MKHRNFGSFRRKVNLVLKPKRDEINANQLLPPGKAIKSLGEHLYTHGIILFPPESNPGVKRKWYYHPGFIFVLELLYFARSFVSLLVPDSNRDYFARSGDFMFFVGAKTHINIAATQLMLTGLSLVTFSYLRYHRAQQPDFFAIYDMLAGKITPAAAGLYESSHIHSLLRRSRTLVTLTDQNTRGVGVFCFVMSIVPLIIKCTAQEVLLYGLPWSFIFSLSGYHAFSCYYWNMTYFYILCHFIKYRLREASCLVQRTAYQRESSQFVLQQNFKLISDQVRRYNGAYWSTVLFLIVLFLSTHNNAVLYAALFVDMNLVTKLALYYSASLTPAVIFFLLNTASVVHQESHVARGTLSKLHVKLHRTLGYRASFKLASVIEALSDKVIGFYFLTLFIINYSRFFEITGMIGVYFLKIIDLSRSR